MDSRLVDEGLDEKFLQYARARLFSLVNVLTTTETIKDDRRVEILLTEIGELVDNHEDCSSRIFKFLSDAFAGRAINESCPDDELDRTIFLIRNTVERFPYPLDNGYISLGRLATALHMRFKKSQNIDDWNESNYLTRHICELDPSLGLSFSNLGTMLYDKYRLGLGNEDDLLESLGSLRRAYELIPPTAHYQSQCLKNLSLALKAAYKKFGSPEYLEEAIGMNRELMFESQNINISNSSWDSSSRTTSTAIGTEEEMALTSLSDLLHLRYELHGTLDDLNEAIEIANDLVKSKPFDNIKGRCQALERLAYYIQSRIKYGININDANDIVEIYREVLQLRMSTSESAEIHRSESLSNLGNALDGQYKISGDKSCLDEAIAIFREAEATTPESNPTRSYILHNLANAMRERYHATGDMSDLEESIILFRESLRLRPTGHELRHTTLHSLSTSLKLKYEHDCHNIYGDAASLFWKRFDGYFVGEVDFSPAVFSIGATFRELFQKSKEKMYIDESIKYLEEALTLTVNSPSSRVLILHSLGNSLWSRSTSHFVEVRYFLYDFIRMKMESVKSPGSILSVINDQLERLKDVDPVSSFGDPDDINLALSCYKEAAGLGDFGIARSHSLMAIANCLSAQFHYSGDINNLLEAIEIYNALLNESKYKFSPQTIANLARTLMKTFIATKDRSYLEEVVRQYRIAMNDTSTSLLTRQEIARRWAHNVNGYHESALEAYQIAVSLLPAIAAANLNIDSRLGALQEAEAARICHEGVGCAVQLGRFKDAVEFLEQGRAIYWSQVLQLRSPVEALSQRSPELATKLQSVSDQLQLGSLRDSLPNDIHDPKQRRSFEDESAYFEGLQLQWEETLAEIRNIEGFEDFLLPKTFSTLQKFLEPDETIVLLSEAGGFDTSSALLVSNNKVQHIPLPDMDAGIIAVILPMVKEGRSLVGYRRRSASINEIPGLDIPDDICIVEAQKKLETYRHGRANYGKSKNSAASDLRDALRWIWDSVSRPVIEALGIQKSNNPKRVWWCPTGPFSFLPLHAAGIYEDDISGREPDCVSDYMISSYIPTIGSLLNRRSNPPEANISSMKEMEMMVVIESQSLPWTVEELQRIKKHVLPEQLTILGDTPSNPATVERVVSRLPTTSIVHFSCHGIQDYNNPLDSAVIMDNGPLTIRHIMQQSMPHSYLAFLCACETATGSEELADEAMNLGTSLLYSGFQSVVATMWSIADEDGAAIADHFYDYLFNKGGLRRGEISLSDENMSAHALHYAVKALKDNGVPLERWIPFIHMGT